MSRSGVIDIVSKGSVLRLRSKYAPGGSQHILPADIPNDIYRKCQHYAIDGPPGAGLPGRLAAPISATTTRRARDDEL